DGGRSSAFDDDIRGRQAGLQLVDRVLHRRDVRRARPGHCVGAPVRRGRPGNGVDVEVHRPQHHRREDADGPRAEDDSGVREPRCEALLDMPDLSQRLLHHGQRFREHPGWFETVRQLHHPWLFDDDQLREEPVEPDDPVLGVALPEAHIWLTRLAQRAAVRTPDRRRDEVARRERRHALSDLPHPAEHLVTENQEFRAVGWLAQMAGHALPVRSTDAATDHLDQDTALVRWRYLDRDVTKGIRAPRRDGNRNRFVHWLLRESVGLRRSAYTLCQGWANAVY